MLLRSHLLSSDKTKSGYDNHIEKLESRLANNHNSKISINGLLEAGIKNLLKLDVAYSAGDSEQKREIIGSMYPEKLTFDGDVLRTTRVNDAARFIYMINSKLSLKKRPDKLEKSKLSGQVGAAKNAYLLQSIYDQCYMSNFKYC